MITLIIPAGNEEKNIGRCLKSVSFCDEVIVMWMGNDNTGKIAKKMGAKVIKKNADKYGDFSAVQENINWAIDHCSNDWILRIDADEVVTKELKQEINEKLKIKNEKLPVAYGIPRKQYFLGGFLKGGDWAYDRLVRLFKKGYARYEPIVSVHEQFKVNGKIGYLKNPLLHFSHPTLKDVFRKFNSYTDLQINDLHDGMQTAILMMLLRPPYIFLRWMIWHHGWRDGWRGVVAGILRGWYEFILYRKYIFSNRPQPSF